MAQLEPQEKIQWGCGTRLEAQCLSHGWPVAALLPKLVNLLNHRSYWWSKRPHRPRQKGRPSTNCISKWRWQDSSLCLREVCSLLPRAALHPNGFKCLENSLHSIKRSKSSKVKGKWAPPFARGNPRLWQQIHPFNTRMDSLWSLWAALHSNSTAFHLNKRPPLRIHRQLVCKGILSKLTAKTALSGNTLWHFPASCIFCRSENSSTNRSSWE